MPRVLYCLLVFKRNGLGVYGAKRYINTLDLLLLWLVRRGGAHWTTPCRAIAPGHYRIGDIAELKRLG